MNVKYLLILTLLFFLPVNSLAQETSTNSRYEKIGTAFGVPIGTVFDESTSSIKLLGSPEIPRNSPVAIYDIKPPKGESRFDKYNMMIHMDSQHILNVMAMINVETREEGVQIRDRLMDEMVNRFGPSVGSGDVRMIAQETGIVSADVLERSDGSIVVQLSMLDARSMGGSNFDVLAEIQADNAEETPDPPTIGSDGYHKIEGMFGFKLGEVYDPSTIRGNQVDRTGMVDSKGQKRYFLFPKNLPIDFDMITALVMPGSEQIYAFHSTKKITSLEEGEKFRQKLFDDLLNKYGVAAPQTPDDTSNLVILQNPNYIRVKLEPDEDGNYHHLEIFMGNLSLEVQAQQLQNRTNRPAEYKPIEEMFGIKLGSAFDRSTSDIELLIDITFDEDANYIEYEVNPPKPRPGFDEYTIIMDKNAKRITAISGIINIKTYEEGTLLMRTLLGELERKYGPSESADFMDHARIIDQDTAVVMVSISGVSGETAESVQVVLLKTPAGGKENSAK